MKLPKNTLYWVPLLGLTLSLLIGIGSRNGDLLAITFLIIALGIGWLFLHLVIAAKIPGVWLKIIFGWAILFVLIGAVRDSSLVEYLPEFNSRVLTPGFALVLLYVLPMIFVFFGLLRKFGSRMEEIYEEQSVKKTLK